MCVCVQLTLFSLCVCFHVVCFNVCVCVCVCVCERERGGQGRGGEARRGEERIGRPGMREERERDGCCMCVLPSQSLSLQSPMALLTRMWALRTSGLLCMSFASRDWCQNMWKPDHCSTNFSLILNR